VVVKGGPLAFGCVSSKSFAVVIAVLAVIGLLGFGLLSKGEASLSVGDTAPDKELSVLGGATTGQIADYRGKWVLVNFWASWCEPCRSEAPALESFHRTHSSQGFTVLGINLDDATDDATEFVERYGLSYPQLRDGDGDDRRDAYGMTGFPESFLIDPQGKIALIRRGPVTESYLDQAVLPLIGARS
jgi:cytochrome c biogenesis protein CcmG/thiol:disulfide interchange protein DsbE